MRQKTPQEKKALSYAKDCRSIYGENDKSSRKNIPLHKARINRSYRNKITEALNKAGGKINLEEAELLDNEVKSIRKDKWKKYPDAPLGEFVESQLGRRVSQTGRGKTARQQISEIIRKLKIDAVQDDDNFWIAKIINLEAISAKAETSERAVEKVKYIAKAAFENAFGFDVRILIDGSYTKPTLEIESGSINYVIGN